MKSTFSVIFYLKRQAVNSGRNADDYAKQVEAGMKAKATLSKYQVVYKHLQEFLNIRYHVEGYCPEGTYSGIYLRF